jgi:hypothetical protein
MNLNCLEINMLVRLLYVSKEIASQPSKFAESNLEKFRESNQANEITGVLCSGEGIFLQVLEGERSAVNKLYVDICKDQRHIDIELLHFEEVTQRAFYAWSMDHIPVSTLYAMIKIQNPEFDPYLSSGKLALNCVMEYLRLNDEPK